MDMEQTELPFMENDEVMVDLPPELDMEEPTPIPGPATPLVSANTYHPQTTAAIIGELTPANFENMFKVLEVLIKEKTTDKITIRDSIIKQSAVQTIVVADMKSILHYHGKFINLDIINPKKYVPNFSIFRNQNNVFIIDDVANQRYLISNGEIKLNLPKQASEDSTEISEFDFTGCEKISARTITLDEKKIIKKLSGASDYVEYLIQDGEIKKINVPEIGSYTFQSFAKDPKIDLLDETNADTILRSNSFLPVETDKYDITIYRLPDQRYISETKCKIGGQIDVTIYEECMLATGGNLFI